MKCFITAKQSRNEDFIKLANLNEGNKIFKIKQTTTTAKYNRIELVGRWTEKYASHQNDHQWSHAIEVKECAKREKKMDKKKNADTND